MSQKNDIRARLATTVNLSDGGVDRAIKGAIAACSDSELTRFGPAIDAVAAAANHAVSLRAAHRAPSDARFVAETVPADRAHDAAAGLLYRIASDLAESPYASDAERDLAARVLAHFFPRGLDYAVNGKFVDQAKLSAQLAETYREGPLPAAFAAADVPGTIEAHVEGFLVATDVMVALVAQQREEGVTYAEVREATNAANDRMREFAWLVAGSLTDRAPETAARRDAILRPYFNEVDAKRRSHIGAPSVASPQSSETAAE